MGCRFLRGRAGGIVTFVSEVGDEDCGDVAVEKTAPDIERVKAARKLKSPSRLGKNVLEICQLADCVFLGLNTHYFVQLSSGEEVEIIQESSIDSIIEPGSEIKLKINTEKVNLFTADGSENILTGVCNDCAKA